MNRIHLYWNPDSRKFYTSRAFAIRVQDDLIVIPAEFGTDFASVPRVLQWLINETGSHTTAALVHDWLYWDQSTTRAKADRIFLRLLRRRCGIMKSWAMYLGVRLGGWLAWGNNGKKKAELREMQR